MGDLRGGERLASVRALFGQPEVIPLRDEFRLREKGEKGSALRLISTEASLSFFG